MPSTVVMDVESLAHRVKQISNRKVSGKTWFAVAGPPGGGKTTLCTKLADCLNAQGVPTAVLPMDGCVHVYIYIYICTCIYANIYRYRYIDTYVFKYIYIHIYMYIYKCIYTRVYTHIYIHIHENIHTCMYEYVHIYT